MPEAGLYRVLDERHEDAWLFVPVGEGTGTATAGDENNESDETSVDDSDATVDGVKVDETPTPGVPGGDGDVDRADEPSPGTGRSYDPVRVPRTGHGEVDGSLAALSPGYLVRATLSRTSARPRVLDLTVRKRTLFEFADDVVGVFEAAESAWASATATGEAMAARVTRGTDGRPNGVLYVFADADGDRLAEFRTGRRPLEPLLARVNDAEPSTRSEWQPADRSPTVGPGGVTVPSDDRKPPAHGLGRDREVFVLRPADGPYVVVLIALRKGGTLADTVRETYHCPRPEEP